MANKSKKTLNKVWKKIFPYIPKVGDKVRLPYGKVDWEIRKIFPEGIVRLRRKARKRNWFNNGYTELPWTITMSVDIRQEMEKVGHI